MSDSYKLKADEFLKQSGLLPVLEKHGRVAYEGAYTGNVMLDGDIDMRVVRDSGFTIDDSFSIMKDIYSNCQDVFRSFYIKSDWADPKIGNEFPNGLYLGFKTEIDGEKWKIDLWLVSEAEHARDRGVLDIGTIDLSEEQRRLILEFKKYRKENGLKIPGLRIYKAVLEEEVTKPEQLSG